MTQTDAKKENNHKRWKVLQGQQGPGSLDPVWPPLWESTIVIKSSRETNTVTETKKHMPMMVHYIVFLCASLLLCMLLIPWSNVPLWQNRWPHLAPQLKLFRAVIAPQIQNDYKETKNNYKETKNYLKETLNDHMKFRAPSKGSKRLYRHSKETTKSL